MKKKVGGGPVKSSRIQCGKCEHGWQIDREVSDPERHAIEANPCGRCGSYTLCCREVQAHVGLTPRRLPIELFHGLPTFVG